MQYESILIDYTKNQFMNFVMLDRDGAILKLLDSNGLEVLKKCPNIEERINYILVYSNYANDLFKNKEFISLFLKTDISSYYANLRNLNEEAYENILEVALENNLDVSQTAKLFSYFNPKYKLEKVSNWPYSKEMLYEVIKHDEAPIISEIFAKYDIDLLSYNINLERLFDKAKESFLKAQSKRNSTGEKINYIQIKSTILTDEVADYLWEKYNIFKLREILNNAAYATDITYLNNKIKQKELNELANFKEGSILPKYFKVFNSFKLFKELGKKLEEDYNLIDDDFYNYRRSYFDALRELKDDKLRDEIETIYKHGGIEAVYNHLNHLSNNYISNLIIDYHFEENYHNIMLDVNELLRFYFDGHTSIDIDRVYLYENILRIDELSFEEKMELHNELKHFNMMEIFYDDMRLARDLVASTIKEYSLTSESIKKYKDPVLSKEYGVDVYKMDGEPFFGIVKSGIHAKDNLPTGHSYSVVGDSGLAVYGDVAASTTYLYDAEDLNPEQIVHVYPYDSFTLFHPFEYSKDATFKVNTLVTPEELVATSSSYNEVLILEQGEKETEIDEKIHTLEKIALYCFDEIRKQDIEAALENQTGIILIETAKYEKENDRKKTYHQSIDSWNYDYFQSYKEEEFEEERRFKI